MCCHPGREQFKPYLHDGWNALVQLRTRKLDGSGTPIIFPLRVRFILTAPFEQSLL